MQTLGVAVKYSGPCLGHLTWISHLTMVYKTAEDLFPLSTLRMIYSGVLF